MRQVGQTLALFSFAVQETEVQSGLAAFLQTPSPYLYF